MWPVATIWALKVAQFYLLTKSKCFKYEIMSEYKFLKLSLIWMISIPQVFGTIGNIKILVLKKMQA